MADSWWISGHANLARPCVVRTSERFGSTSSSARFAQNWGTGQREAPEGCFRCNRQRSNSRRSRCGGAMSVKPELAFDVCWEVYRGAREVLETKRGISALNWKDTGKFLWRPDFRPRLNEWVADFALAGQAALDGPDWASRMVLFRLYYLGLAPYENARHFLGLSEHGWVNWSEEIRHRCGRELLRRGMFPPRKYFRGVE